MAVQGIIQCVPITGTAFHIFVLWYTVKLHVSMTGLGRGPPPELGAFAEKMQFHINTKRSMTQLAKKKKEDRSGSLNRLPRLCFLIMVASLSF